MIGVAVPGDSNAVMKQNEKVEKHQPLKYEIMRVWRMKHVAVVPMVVGALATVTKMIQSWIRKIKGEFRTALLQKTAFPGTVRISRRVPILRRRRNARTLGHKL